MPGNREMTAVRRATVSLRRAIVATVATGLAFLAPQANAGGWSADLTVVSVFTEASTDLIVVNTSGGAVYAPGCIANQWIFVADTDARRARGYATLLTASATGQRVRMWFNDTCTTWNYHGIYAVMLVN